MVLALAAALLLAADPTARLESFAGLNVKALKPWLVTNLPSLTKCGLVEHATVRADFSTSPDITSVKVEGSKDSACVKAVVESWRNDGTQPRGGSFSFIFNVTVR